jgi:hypothetical protein
MYGAAPAASFRQITRATITSSKAVADNARQRIKIPLGAGVASRLPQFQQIRAIFE